MKAETIFCVGSHFSDRSGMPPRPVRGLITAPAMRRCNSRYSRGVWRLGGDFFGLDVFNESVRLQGLAVDFLERGDVGVPFQQGGRRAGAAESPLVKLPDRVDDGMIVGVKNVLAVLGVSGDVKLRDAGGREVVHVV